MQTIYLVTGNPGKLREFQALFPKRLNLQTKDVDLTEIQSMSSQEIIRDKLQRAYEIIKQPVIAEDVSAELGCLNGLPGPFMKFFENALGKSALWELAQHHKDRSATIRCTMGYYDGQDFRIVEATVTGQIVSPRGTEGFGFDYVFMPDGYDQTSAEMGLQAKNKISHRALAIQKLVKILP
jgi:inosine triphosphate pyrophosphatase